MCGIAGIVDFRTRPVSPDRLLASCGSLAHRGPDDSGTWLDNGDRLSIGLAHTRLAIIDPRPAGRQPMVDATGRYRIVFNGEIYNFQELRGELQESGRVFASETDTEVILNGYAQWGESLLDRMEGMWAFCLYDIPPSFLRKQEPTAR